MAGCILVDIYIATLLSGMEDPCGELQVQMKCSDNCEELDTWTKGEHCHERTLPRGIRGSVRL
jgi:hypothetical protein